MFSVKTQAKEPYRTAVGVEARISDVLNIRRQLQTRPLPWQLQAVIGFKDLFVGVIQASVVEQKSCAAGREVLAVRRRKTLNYNCRAHLVGRATPVRAR